MRRTEIKVLVAAWYSTSLVAIRTSHGSCVLAVKERLLSLPSWDSAFHPLQWKERVDKLTPNYAIKVTCLRILLQIFTSSASAPYSGC